MKYLYFLVALLVSSLPAAAQHTYPPDSLTTQPSIPRSAVTIRKGLPSGPDARLAHAVYNNIRFPRTALVSRTGGKVLVYGMVDTMGVFRVDSAGLFREQSTLVVEDSTAVMKKQDIPLGYVREFTQKKKKWLLADAPKKWSLAEKDLVLEAVRVTRALPRFRPGTIRGQKVPANVNVPVVFRHSGRRL